MPWRGESGRQSERMTDTTEPILEISNVTIKRGPKRLLTNVSWTIQRGEHWVILGANGSGKTSLLSALTGFLTPSKGDITLLGNTFGQSNWQELKKRIGVVSSAVRELMSPHETALETVASGPHGMIDFWGTPDPEEVKASRSLLRRLGCRELEDRPWAVLSQGERQRVLIGRALMAKPDLLILDEPCAGLDPAAREHFLHFVQSLLESDSSPAIILVTHHVEEIMPGFTHTLALRGGKIVASGPNKGVLKTAIMDQLFSATTTLRKIGGRFNLKVEAVNGKRLM